MLHLFGQDEIQTDADNGSRFAFGADGFNQNAAKLAVSRHQIVRPFDLRGDIQLGKRIVAGQSNHQGQGAQLRLRHIEHPTEAECQAFADAAVPVAPLPAAPVRLFVHQTEAAVGGGDTLFGLRENDIVAGRMPVQQFDGKTGRGSGKAFRRKNRQRSDKAPIAVVLAQQAADMAGHFQPQAVELLRLLSDLARQLGNMLRQAV